jgi:hypothetical protein
MAVAPCAELDAGELADHSSSTSRTIWAQLVRSGEIDSAVLRFLVVQRAVRWARACQLQVTPGHRALATMTIACAHGYHTWRELEGAFSKHLEVWLWIEDFAADLTLAKCARQRLFEREHGTSSSIF